MSHKYIKRTGSQGNYRYWYKLPDGRIAEGNDAQQKQGRVEHVKRLIAGKDAGHHTFTHDSIARITGHDPEKVRSLASNMATAKRAGRTHDFQEHQMHEAQHTETGSPEYARHVESHAAGDEAGGAAAPASAPASRPARPRRSRGVERGRGTEPEGPGPSEAPAAAAAPSTPRVQPERANAGPRANPAPAEDPREARKRELLGKLKNEHGLDLNPPAATPAAAAPSAPAADHEGPTGSAEEAATARRMSERLAAGQPSPGQGTAATPAAAGGSQPAHTPAPTNLGASVTPQVPGAGARSMGTPEGSQARPTSAPPVNPASAATSPGGQELTRFDPDFAASEAATTRMIEQQQQGNNPYLVRAADIFGRIMHDVQEPRKTKVRNMLNALVRAHNESKEHGTTFNKDLVLAHYKAIPGNERARSLPDEDFERATFHSPDEVIDNAPINPELERMKRGFAMKQFNRVKPYLKPSFLAGLGADGSPPPYPTFGDLKSWSEHKAGGGGEKPAWAGTSRTAMPREVHEAAHKGPDGKPLHAPGWMPLHLTPVWNYVAAKSLASGSNPYQAPAPREQQVGGPSGRVNLPNQAGAQEGILINALRKYVQQRGGVHQLVDIPKSKLMEVGKTHEDIFKGEDEERAAPAGGIDKELTNALKTKIVDPVALMPFVMKELGIKPPKEKGGAADKAVKSIELVVDGDADYEPGETLLKAAPLLRKSAPPALVIDIRKSQRIARIQEELRARGV